MRAALTAVASTLKRGAPSVKRKMALGPLDFTVGFCTTARGFRLLEIGWAEAEGTEAGGPATVAAHL